VDPRPPASDPSAPQLPPASDPLSDPPSPAPPPSAPVDPPPLGEATPIYESQPPPSDPRGEAPEPMSEGRRIVVAYNTGFQWGLSPGVIFSSSKASFFLGLRFGYGFDTGSVIIVPGVRIAGYFTDPNVYIGMPVVKLVYPIDRFAPFIEGGAGVGYVAQDSSTSPTIEAKTGAALLVGAGFMVHFNWKFGLGVEANYQVVTGTDFAGFGIGPILALSF
jgi:hypothetical protein